jgi:hypothetical protein
LAHPSGVVRWLPSNEPAPVARARLADGDVYRAAKCGGAVAITGEIVTFAASGSAEPFRPSAPERHRIEALLAQKKPAEWPNQIDVSGIWLRSIDGDTDGDGRSEKVVMLGLPNARPLVVLFAGNGAPGDQMFDAGIEPSSAVLLLGMFDVDADAKPEVAFASGAQVVLFEIGSTEQTRIAAPRP